MGVAGIQDWTPSSGLGGTPAVSWGAWEGTGLGSAGAKTFLLLFNAPGTSRSTSISEQSLSKGEI